jgi:hypothetical protein
MKKLRNASMTTTFENTGDQEEAAALRSNENNYNNDEKINVVSIQTVRSTYLEDEESKF